ncbi:hypothetical protein Tco_1331355, partial [Tanacetum coccineum]
IQGISLTGFPAHNVGSSNTDVLDLSCLLVLITRTSSKQTTRTSSIHVESCKSPTKSLFDVGSSRISIFIVNTKSITLMFWQISQGYCVGLLLTTCELDDVQQVFEIEFVLTRFRLISGL